MKLGHRGVSDAKAALLVFCFCFFHSFPLHLRNPPESKRAAAPAMRPPAELLDLLLQIHQSSWIIEEPASAIRWTDADSPAVAHLQPPESRIFFFLWANIRTRLWTLDLWLLLSLASSGGISFHYSPIAEKLWSYIRTTWNWWTNDDRWALVWNYTSGHRGQETMFRINLFPSH